MITVAEAITRLEREEDSTLGEISGDLFINWLNDLNTFLYRVVVKADPENWIEEDTTTTVAGTTTYALPDDFKHIKSTNTGFYVSNKLLRRVNYGSSRNGYRIRGANFIVSEPTTAYDIVLRYIPRVTKLTSETSELVVDYEDFVAVLNYLESRYGKWNIDINKEMNADQRFEREIQQLFMNNTRENKVFNLTSRA